MQSSNNNNNDQSSFSSSDTDLDFHDSDSRRRRLFKAARARNSNIRPAAGNGAMSGGMFWPFALIISNTNVKVTPV